MSEKGGMDVNEAILGEMAQMLLKERLDRAERAHVVRGKMDHRVFLDANLSEPRSLQASRTACRETGQEAY